MADFTSPTEAERAALRAIGYVNFGTPSEVLEVYRAGFADGRKLPEPRVFHRGDPEPGLDVMAVLDGDGDVWVRSSVPGGDWHCPVGIGDWEQVQFYAPLVACLPVPDYVAVVGADADRRAAAGGSAGGDR